MTFREEATSAYIHWFSCRSPLSWLNRNSEMLVFQERGKIEVTGENPQSKVRTKNKLQVHKNPNTVYGMGLESSLGHIGGT